MAIVPSKKIIKITHPSLAHALQLSHHISVRRQGGILPELRNATGVVCSACAPMLRQTLHYRR
jgi:hypothetical protein